MALPSPARRRRLLLVAPFAALALSGLLTGCGSDNSTSSTDGSASTGSTSSTSTDTEVDVEIKGDTITPTNKSIEIGVGDTVTLHVTADRSGELHVHSSPEQQLEFKSGETDFDLTLDKPGSVDVEEHASETLILRILVS